MILPIALEDSPASFPAGLMGDTRRGPNGAVYVLCKNTDASSLASGRAVTMETPATFYVDLVSTAQPIFGIVTNELTGDVAAVNDAVWVQVAGLCYAQKGLATGSAAIAVGQYLGPRASGHVMTRTTTVGSQTVDVIGDFLNIKAESAVASSATTNVLVWLM